MRKFYRILAFSTSATDSDGDGLSDAFEAQIGTNPATVDSDGDGFRDGFEFLAGTDPNDPNEFPDDQRHLPEVEFETVLSSATEGDGPHTLAITASDNFTGTVHYAVNARSSAISGVDFQALPNTVNLTSGTGAITLDLIDDTNISKQERLLLIDILPDPGSAYRASGGSRTLYALVTMTRIGVASSSRKILSGRSVSALPKGARAPK